MAQYAAELYRDDDAIAFAARAVQLSPDDAEGHRKLGEMYRKKQDFERAIVEFRAAIAKNDKLFPVYFELAELLLSRGESRRSRPRSSAAWCARLPTKSWCRKRRGSRCRSTSARGRSRRSSRICFRSPSATRERRSTGGSSSSSTAP